MNSLSGNLFSIEQKDNNTLPFLDIMIARTDNNSFI